MSSRGRAPVKETYSTHDVAKICCVTPTTVIRWIEDGLIPAFKTVGGHRRVRRDDLERVCRERNIPFTVPVPIEAGRILVIDDEPETQVAIQDAIQTLPRTFEIEVARDAFDAGRHVVAFRPQLVFLDLLMPGLDGVEVCARLRRDSRTKHIEVIATTSFGTDTKLDRVLSAGASGMLHKPLEPDLVRQHVGAAFELTPPGALAGEGRAAAREEPPKVLVITQNADFRSRVREELSASFPPVEVLTAQTGADALLVARAAPPQFVILSMSVPDIQSTGVIETLIGSGRGVQIIAVHDAPSEAMRHAVRTAGARMCLPTQAVTGSVRELLGL